MISSRSVSDLHPKVQLLCNKFITACAIEHIEVLITSTYRDAASQNALYAQGRTTPGHIVTNAKAGKSFHNWRVAFDFVPIVNGKAQWNDLELFNKCGKIAKECGLEWAGDWVKFRELAHCQQSFGLSLLDFQQGKGL